MFKNYFIRRAGVAILFIGLWAPWANAPVEAAGDVTVPLMKPAGSRGPSSFQAVIPGIYALNAAAPPGDPAVRRAVFEALTSRNMARSSLLGLTFADGDAITLAAASNEPSAAMTSDRETIESRSTILRALSVSDALVEESRKSAAGGRSASANTAAKLVEMASNDELFSMDGASMVSLYDVAETDSQTDRSPIEISAGVSLGMVSREPLKWPLLWAVCGAVAMGGVAYIMEVVARRRSW